MCLVCPVPNTYVGMQSCIPAMMWWWCVVSANLYPDEILGSTPQTWLNSLALSHVLHLTLSSAPKILLYCMEYRRPSTCWRCFIIVVIVMLLGSQLDKLDQTTPQRHCPWHADGAPTLGLAVRGPAELTQGHYVPDVVHCQWWTTCVHNISQPDRLFEPNRFVPTFATGKGRSGQRRFYQFKSQAEQLCMPLDASGWRWPHFEKGKEPHWWLWSGHKP